MAMQTNPYNKGDAKMEAVLATIVLLQLLIILKICR